MISKAVLCDDVFVVFFFKTVYNKTILRFVFRDVWNGHSVKVEVSVLASAALLETLIIPDITFASSNNCF